MSKKVECELRNDEEEENSSCEKEKEEKGSEQG